MADKTSHEGRNVKRIREMLGIKQEALAFDLGLSQQAVSALEQKEALDKDILEKIAAVLKVPAQVIKDFDEEKAVYNIQNNYEGSNNQGSNNGIYNYQCTINPFDKIVDLYESKIELFERMLKDKDGMIARLEELLKSKKE